MARIIGHLVFMIIMAMILYLVGCAIQLNFNPAQWHIVTRALLSVLLAWISIVSF